jgi:hypothetical protein
MINATKVNEKMAPEWRMHDKCNQIGWKNGPKVEDAIIKVTKMDEKMAPKWRMHW